MPHEKPQSNARSLLRTKQAKVIFRIQNTKEIIPIFRTYLEQIHPYLDIYNVSAWRHTALKNLGRYDREKGRHIYALNNEGSIMGFSMVNQHLRFNTRGFAIADFFIADAFKKKGYGSQLAGYLFTRFPGSWEVAVSRKNKTAKIFWEKVISAYTHDNFTINETPGFDGRGITFTSP